MSRISFTRLASGAVEIVESWGRDASTSVRLTADELAQLARFVRPEEERPRRNPRWPAIEAYLAAEPRGE
jgi:hypothetical protein